MGADLLALTAVVDAEKHHQCTLDKIEALLADEAVVQRIMDAEPSYQLRDEIEMTGEYINPDTADDPEAANTANGEADIKLARAILLTGAESFLDGIRTHIWLDMGHGIELIVAGGLSWGDDPYDGFNQEIAFLDAAVGDPDLRALTGIIAGVPEIDAINEYIRERDGN